MRARLEVEPADEGKTKVTGTFDRSPARFSAAWRAMGLTKGHDQTVAASVGKVAAHSGE